MQKLGADDSKGPSFCQLQSLFDELDQLQQRKDTNMKHHKSKTMLSNHYEKILPQPSPKPQPNGEPKKSVLGVRDPDDVVICYSKRSPQTKSKKKGLKDTFIEVIMQQMFEDLLVNIPIKPEDIDDVVMGNVLAPGCGLYGVRLAQMFSKMPFTVPVSSVNRFCGSGLEAISTIAAKIKSGYIDCGIGGGIESMSMYDMMSLVPLDRLPPQAFETEQGRNILLTTGQVAENCASDWGITRQQQDAFSVESHTRAINATKNGWFKKEIVPIKTEYKDNKTGETVKVTVDQDDGMRESTVEGMGKLRTPFKKDGTVTAGTASQISDGCAMSFVARRSFAEKHNLPILAKFVDYTVVGVKPELFGLGPEAVINKLFERTKLTKDDVDLIEINEAFANIAVYTMDKLGLDHSKVNVNGGAVALGHPLGCSGARMVATILNELQRRQQKVGLVTMCIGTGMGNGCILELQ